MKIKSYRPKTLDYLIEIFLKKNALREIYVVGQIRQYIFDQLDADTPKRILAVSFYQGTLKIKTNSSALKQEWILQKTFLINHLNEVNQTTIIQNLQIY